MRPQGTGTFCVAEPVHCYTVLCGLFPMVYSSFPPYGSKKPHFFIAFERVLFATLDALSAPLAASSLR